MTNLVRGGRAPAVGLVLLACASAAAAGCAKKDDAGKPSGVPPLTGAPSAPAAALPPPAMPAPAPAAEPPAPPPDPNATITGEITVAAAQKANIAPGDTIFLVARRISDNPTARGTLIAVKKLSAAKLPQPFTLSAADMPFQTGPFDGELTISVRVDKDGDPMTHKKGDVVGGLPKVRVGARDVKLVLNQTQKEDESLAQPGGPMGGGPAGGPSGMMGHPQMPADHGLPPGHP